MSAAIQHIRSIDLKNDRAVSVVAVCGDGSRIAVAAGRVIDLFDADTGKRIHQIPMNGPITGMAISPDARLLAVAVDGPTVSIHNCQTGEIAQKLTREKVPDYLRERRQQRVVFFPDSKLLITSADNPNRGLTFWNCESGRWDHIITTPNPKSTVVISTDGQYVATVGNAEPKKYHGHVSMFRVRSGLQLLWNKSHAGDRQVTCAAFSPKGMQLATGGAGDGIKVWMVASGVQTAHIRGVAKDQPFIGVTFVQDEQHLLTATSQGLQLRRITNGRTLATARNRQQTGMDGFASSKDGSLIGTHNGTAVVDVWKAVADKTE